MAKAALSLDAKLNSLMQCRICYKKVTDHRMLPCQHLFCVGCLEPRVWQRGKRGKTIQCPTCRKIHRLKSSGVAGLPKNEILVSMLDKRCESCLDQKREVHCESLEKSVCRECHKKCPKPENSNDRIRIFHLTNKANKIRLQQMKAIQWYTIGFSHVFSALSKQIDKSAEAAIQAVKSRQKDLHQELDERIKTEMDKQSALLANVSADVDKLKDLMSYFDADKDDQCRRNFVAKFRDIETAVNSTISLAEPERLEFQSSDVIATNNESLLGVLKIVPTEEDVPWWLVEDYSDYYDDYEDWEDYYDDDYDDDYYDAYYEEDSNEEEHNDNQKEMEGCGAGEG